MKYWLFRLCLLFMTIAPAFAEDAAEKTVHATPAMWVVHGPKGTAYLLGSVHVLPKNIDWQTPTIKAAIKSANAFVFEVPMAEDSRSRAALLFGANELLPPSVSLPSYFDAEMRSEFRAAVEHTQVDPEGLVVLRPWRAAQLLEGAMTGKYVLESDQGVDNRVYAMANERGVRDIRAFETDEFQLQLIKGKADTSNELALLRDAMKKAANRPMLPFKKLLDAWEAGDPAAVAAVSVATMAPDEKKAMLDDRNHNWIPKIEKMLTEKRTFFITVGAAHLAGPGGVPALLRQAGYKVDGPDVSGEAASITAPSGSRVSDLRPARQEPDESGAAANIRAPSGSRVSGLRPARQEPDVSGEAAIIKTPSGSRVSDLRPARQEPDESGAAAIIKTPGMDKAASNGAAARGVRARPEPDLKPDMKS